MHNQPQRAAFAEARAGQVPGNSLSDFGFQLDYPSRRITSLTEEEKRRETSEKVGTQNPFTCLLGCLLGRGKGVWGMEIGVGPTNIVDHASSAKEFRWVSAVLAGILMCKIVYDLTDVISAALLKEYNRVDSKQKVEWRNRGFSTFHAIVVATGSLYLVISSNLFDDSRDGLIVKRTSTSSDTTLGFSMGYFLSDLAMIFYYYPALGGIEYIIHHGLSLLSILHSLVIGQGHIYALMILFSEVTTPFVNLRWYLDVAGLKNSKLYLYNGVALFLGWLVARIILFIYFFYHLYIHFDQVKQIHPLCFYPLLIVPPVLAAMNIFWFWKIARGMVKTLNKATHRK